MSAGAGKFAAITPLVARMVELVHTGRAMRRALIPPLSAFDQLAESVDELAGLVAEGNRDVSETVPGTSDGPR